jgi:hypothetical protein
MSKKNVIPNDVVTAVRLPAYLANLPEEELLAKIDNVFNAAKQNCYDSIMKKRQE